MIALYVNGNNIIYFDSLGVKNIPKEIKKFVRNKKNRIMFIEYRQTIR